MRVESGKWRVESGKWKMENGKWRVLVEEIGFSNEKCFVPGCINVARAFFESTSGSPAIRGGFWHKHICFALKATPHNSGVRIAQQDFSSG